MLRGALVCIAIAVLLGGCGRIPYRTEGLASRPDCQALYDKHDDITVDNKKIPAGIVDDPCWLRAKEERNNYDLMFMEFDDQGWVQDSKGRQGKSEDYFDAFFDELGKIYDANQENGLSVVVFVHGWHHNADPRDRNVTEFRHLLRDIAIMEQGRKLDDAEPAKSGRRVLGIYIGWRGESITVPVLNNLTFWERKNTAERVSQGSVLEFFSRMDLIRDRGRKGVPMSEINIRDRKSDATNNVRMLTIGHSFGGLITYEALGGEFIRVASRSRSGDYVSRLGDLVIIANPAFEGSRYEPLRLAGRRLQKFEDNQLPVIIVATSQADLATGTAFPLARRFNTLFESTPGPEGDAIVKAVGHNERYTTHQLALCDKSDEKCARTCFDEQKSRSSENREDIKADIREELKLMRSLVKTGIGKELYLCGGLQLKGTENWSPEANPFWVVSTTKDIMNGHNDIFNPNFVSFIRQMYLSVILETDRKAKQ